MPDGTKIFKSKISVCITGLLKEDLTSCRFPFLEMAVIQAPQAPQEYGGFDVGTYQLTRLAGRILPGVNQVGAESECRTRIKHKILTPFPIRKSYTIGEINDIFHKFDKFCEKGYGFSLSTCLQTISNFRVVIGASIERLIKNMYSTLSFDVSIECNPEEPCIESSICKYHTSNMAKKNQLPKLPEEILRSIFEFIGENSFLESRADTPCEHDYRCKHRKPCDRLFVCILCNTYYCLKNPRYMDVNLLRFVCIACNRH
jgi:hypothetical protein